MEAGPRRQRGRGPHRLQSRLHLPQAHRLLPSPLAPPMQNRIARARQLAVALLLALGASSIVSAQTAAPAVSAQTMPAPQTQVPLPIPAQQLWRFDNLASLGGHPTKIVGTPQLIDTPKGKAVAFNGIDSALFVDVHPLAGAATWTWEMVFRPDPDGKPEQRVFHLQ